MIEDLNRALALASQAHSRLLGLVSDDELADFSTGKEAPSHEVTELLRQLNALIAEVSRLLGSVVADGGSSLILQIPQAHRTFWTDTLSRQASKLQRAYLHAAGLGIMADIVDFPSADTQPRLSKHNAMNWGLQRWYDNSTDEELSEWEDRGFDIQGALELTSQPWFKPDHWSLNLHLLSPVVVDRPTSVLRDHVRYRLVEIYRAFSFELWMSAIALSRSLVDFSLRSNAPRFDLITTITSSQGEELDKSLKQLAADYSARLPNLEQPLQLVRDTGNRILHPKKRDVIAHPKVMKSEALDCIKAARLIVEVVYSEVSPK
jgi:hypothetical protein